MTTLSVVKAILEADATLLAAATGGIYDLTETGAEGINRTTVPAAFDSNLIIKPCILVKLRSSIPDSQVVDNANQLMSFRDMVECWLYQFGAYDQITAMSSRIYALLSGKHLTGTALVMWAGDTQPMRNVDLDSYVVRSDYLAVSTRSV